ncbi:MAG: NAD(P)/FAD-dependent oxidoreductase, partial [Shimia sp.]
PFWGGAPPRPIARNAQSAARGGRAFFLAVGGVWVAPDDAALRAVAAQRVAQAIPSTRFAGPCAPGLPFAFAPGSLGFHEARGAGHVSPRALVAAQQAAAERLGATRLRAEALSLDGPRIETSQGVVAADHVILAAGGASHTLLPSPLPLRTLRRTVAFFALEPPEAARLAAMPSLIYRDAAGTDVYVLPPIRYPDGRVYVKIGGDRRDVALEGRAAIAEWYRSGGDPEVGAYLEDDLRRLLPDVAMTASHIRPCMTSYTPDGLPVIGEAGPHLTVATAGNGKAAKSSDELGRLAALSALGHPPPGLGPERFPEGTAPPPGRSA